MSWSVSFKGFYHFSLAIACTLVSAGIGAQTINLADKPIGSTVVVPANVILDLSVEFPTADSDAYYTITTYNPNDTVNYPNGYSGYFNPNYCYAYQPYIGLAPVFGTVTGYFVPKVAAVNHVCNAGSPTVRYWSGNFLNWALTQTIDPFRQTLTGGARIVDTTTTSLGPGMTILQKAYSDSQSGTGNQQVKSLGNATLVAGATPFTWNAFYISNYHTGLNFVFSGSNLNSYPVTGIDFSTILYTAASQTVTYQAQGAVQVCLDGTSDTSRTCRAYGNTFKPVGLMQKYAAETTSQTDAIRYAAFGYLRDAIQNTNNQQMDGGVLRAKMKSVGPYQANPGTTPSANANTEWDAKTGIFVPNPNPTDASSTPADPSSVGGVSNSGVISYLNNFGFSAASSSSVSSAYKVYDPVGELYYAATRYYRNLGNISTYTSNAAVTAKEALNDNFPVITTWDDPVKYSCSKNYIIGIGDIHTWNDADVPGASVHSSYDINQSISDDTGSVVNATTATDYIAKLENMAGYTGKGNGVQNGSSDYIPVTTLGDNLIGNIGSPSGGWGASQNSFYMAGLAYDVHTRDIRPDIPNKSKPVTVSTFWIDVFESADYHEKNQFWMTAKYGGFDTSTTSFPSGYTEYGTPAALPLASWNTGGYVDDTTHNNLAPDQYFQAAKPSAMASGLSAAFAKIQANVPTGTSTALGLSSNTVSGTGDANYAASFGSNWTGEVVGETINQNVVGGSITVSTSVIWHASYWLPPYNATSNPGITPLTAVNRIIATSSANGAGKGVAFEYTPALGSSNLSAIGSSDVLNYVRGDNSKETTNGGTFRPRATVLGDITNSKLQVISAPSFPYADAPLNPGYSSFQTLYKNRGTVVYVGANDGMMHAFDGSLSSATAGKELFAYVPSYLFNINTDSTNNLVGLSSLTVNPLQHHFMVDSQASVNDVDFARTNGNGFSTSLPSNWHTVLFSGLGKGGKGFFAIDVTNPSAITSESALAGNVLWETNPSSADFKHMGYSYGTPLVVKTKRWGWTVVLTSGYNNDDGMGYIYLVNPKDGTLYESLATGAGGTSTPAGLAFVGGAIPNVADFTADALYAGDLLGNVWRVDLTSTTTTTIAKFATLTDSGGIPQPITTEPVIQADPNALTRYVFVGTGRLLADTDLVTSNQQTFYALNDGTNATFSTISAPLTRLNLVNNSSAAAITGGTFAGVTLGSKNGYYIDLATYPASAGKQAAAERVNIQPVAAAGVVSFAANLYGQDICSSGSSRLFGLSYESSSSGIIGNSLLTNSTGGQIASATVASTSGAVTGLSIVSSPTGLQILAGTGSGGVTGFGAGGNAASLTKLNWREVPAAQ